MRFQVLDIIGHQDDPITGLQVSTAQRFEQVIQSAVRAEELGFDSFSVGERHAGAFISSSPAVVLGAIAAQTQKIRLHTGVIVLSILDPVRVAEDFATVDQLSNGRLELGIGKGNEAAHFPMFGKKVEDQWDLLEENYELLAGLFAQDPVDFTGGFRTPLEQVTTSPRPLQHKVRIWHGSATSLRSAELADRHGDPLFSANAIQPKENYKVLIDHYKNAYEQAGHDPAHRYIGSGSGAGGVYLADSTKAAIKEFGPVYEALTNRRDVPGNNTPYRSIEHAVEEGPLLVGSPEFVAAKILDYHQSFGHDLQSISLPTTQPFEAQIQTLERFAQEVIPRVNTQTTLWTQHDPQFNTTSENNSEKEYAR
ncbi:LLM class flavin-dependent oxidoreductase [Glutamicibacter sp.]|uniref:LLM class flavin-dependent oxidoreductase n=1 Tax=Glutamicibacter sp. TaxID=1931995 RepID=UPI002FE05A04